MSSTSDVPARALVVKARAWSDSWYRIALSTAKDRGHRICGAKISVDPDERGWVRESTNEPWQRAEERGVGKRPCLDRAVKQNGRCRRHGGKVPTGPNSPHYKHGEDRRVLEDTRIGESVPLHLQDKFYQAVKDERLRELNEHIAAADTRIRELLSALDDGGTIDQWKRVIGVLQEYRERRGEDDEMDAEEMAERIQDIADAEFDDRMQWREIREERESLRKTAKTSVRNEKARDELVHVEDVRQLLAGFLKGARAALDDRSKVQEIQERALENYKGLMLEKGDG